MKKKTVILARLVLATTLLTSCGEEESKPSRKEYREPNTTYWEDVLVEQTLTEETIKGW